MNQMTERHPDLTAGSIQTPVRHSTFI